MITDRTAFNSYLIERGPEHGTVTIRIFAGRHYTGDLLVHLVMSDADYLAFAADTQKIARDIAGS